MADLDWFAGAVARMMRDVSVMTLATSGPDGPWAADVYFAADGWNLIFLSSPRSRHCRDISALPMCAVTIHPQPPGSWRDITGLQLTGTARPAEGPKELAHVLRRYVSKFPFANDLVSSPGTAASLATSARPHIFVPTWIRLVDNTRGFGRPFSAVVSPDGHLGRPAQADRQ